MAVRCVLRWLIGLTLILFLLVACFGWWVTQAHKHVYEPPLYIIAESIGQELADRSQEKAVLQQLLSEPLKLIALLKSEDAKVRQAALYLLLRHEKEIQLSADEIKAIIAGIEGDSSGRTIALIKVADLGGSPGLMALTTLLEGPEVPTVAQIHALRRSFRREDALEAIKRLAEIATDQHVPMACRLAALEVIADSERNSRMVLAELESLAESESGEVAEAARFATARARKMPDLERITADLAWYRQYEPYFLGSYLREVGEFGEAARHAGSELLKELKPLGDDAGQHAALALAKIGYREAIPRLIDALGNKDDWQFVAGAAEALGRLKAKEAEGALRKVADEAVFPEVRQIALNALLSMQNQYEYSDQFTEVQLLWSVGKTRRQQLVKAHWWEKWSTYEAIENLWRDLCAGWIALTSPRVTVVRIQHTEGESEISDFDMQPRHRLRLREGILLGYDEGEFGSGLVYWTKDTVPRYLRVSNVTQIVPWPDGAIVIASVWEDSMAYKIDFAMDGEIRLEPFKRLPEGYHRCTLERDGSLNFYDDLRLTTDGRLENIRLSDGN